MLKKRAPKLQTPTSDKQKAAARKKTVSAAKERSGKAAQNKRLGVALQATFSRTKSGRDEHVKELKRLQAKAAKAQKLLTKLSADADAANKAYKKAKK